MNIAFQALLLILFYLPGALFIAALFGRLSKDQELPVISLSITGRAAAALLSAGAFHALWLAGIRQLANWGFHIISAAKQFFILLSSSQQSVDYLQTDDWESRNLDCLFWYFASICAGAGAMGAFLHWVIARFKLDYKFAWLRFKPQWHYLLSAEYAADPNSVVWIDALTEIDKETIVYSGLVKEYWFDDKTSALDTIWLESAERLCVHLCLRDSTAASEPPLRAVQIPGARFGLKMSEVKNMNILYVSLASESNSPDVHAEAAGASAGSR